MQDHKYKVLHLKVVTIIVCTQYVYSTPLRLRCSLSFIHFLRYWCAVYLASMYSWLTRDASVEPMTCKLLNSVADGVPLCKLLYTQLTAFLTIFIIILIEIRVGWENKYLFWIAGMHISGHIHFRLWTPYRTLTLHYHKSKSLHEVTAQSSQCSGARHIHISILSLYNTTRHALIYYKPPSYVEQEVVVFIALMYECSVKLNVSTTQQLVCLSNI